MRPEFMEQFKIFTESMVLEPEQRLLKLRYYHRGHVRGNIDWWFSLKAENGIANRKKYPETFNRTVPKRCPESDQRGDARNKAHQKRGLNHDQYESRCRIAPQEAVHTLAYVVCCSP